MKIFILTGACFIVPLAEVPTAHAEGPPQTSPAPTVDERGIGDIIVTARRREERLQEVPVSITAFSGRDLERRQIVDVQALTQNAPAITFSSTPYGNNDLILAIRGVAPGGTLPNVDQAVGSYVDGLYYARSQGSNFALVDIASAEVLRGPQGTLFGRNTIGGALNITTNKPTYKFEGSFKGAVGNYDALSATGIVNVPLIDQKLAARFVYSHVQHEGYGFNRALQSEVADQNDEFFRGSLRADPVRGVRIDVSGDYYNGNNHQPNWIVAYYQSGVSPANVAPYVAQGESRINQGGLNPVNRSTVYDISGTVTIDLGFAALKSITGYRNINYKAANDQDGTPIAISDQTRNDFIGDQISEELQLGGVSGDSRLTWVFGGYYFRETFTNPIVIHSGTQINLYQLSPNNHSASVFAQATYEIVPKLRLTGGVRYVVDRRRISYDRSRTLVAAASQDNPDPPASVLTPAPCPLTAIGLNQYANGCGFAPAPIKFTNVPFTIGLDYKPDEQTLLYGKFSRGYRSGGFQQSTGSTVAFFTPFDEERLDSYEVGAKLAFFDNRLRLSMSGYYSTYYQVQQNSVLPDVTPAVIAVVNAGQERIYGGELEATVLLRKLRLSGSLGLIDPKFTKGPYVGTPVPTVAKTTWALSADYPIEIEDVARLDLHADYNYRSTVYFLNTGSVGTNGALIPYTAFQAASVKQSGYGLLSARVSLTPAHLPMTLSIYGRNLTDRYYAGRTGTQASRFFNTILLGDPRTYGVSVAVRF